MGLAGRSLTSSDMPGEKRKCCESLDDKQQEQTWIIMSIVTYHPKGSARPFDPGTPGWANCPNLGAVGTGQPTVRERRRRAAGTRWEPAGRHFGCWRQPFVVVAATFVAFAASVGRSSWQVPRQGEERRT